MNKKVVLAFGIAALSCGSIAPAFADDPVTGSTDFTVTVNPYLNLTLTSADMSAGNIIHLPLTPSSSGTYGSKSLTATASTNNAYGYTLVMSTPHTYLESNTINVNDGTYPHIEAIESRTGGRTAAEFEANTYNDMNKWGISIDNTTSYNPIALSQNLKKVTTPVADSATVINMATVLDLLTPPGSYSATMNFELVANAATGSLEQALIDAGKEKVTVGNNKYYKIQDVNTAICNATTDTTGTLEVVDVRDNTIYHISKFADNRCWLLDNLALDLTNTNVKNAMYDSTDPTHNTMTNATNEQLGYLFNGGRDNNDSSTNNLPTAGLANWTSSNSYSVPLMNISNKDVISSDSLDTAGGWKVGGYYNYCAASAGSYCYGDGTSAGAPSGNATADICPSGWRMPTGGFGGEYQLLADAITGGAFDWVDTEPESSNTIRSALRLPLSGDFSNGSAPNQGSFDALWSSTLSDEDYMECLAVNSSHVYPYSFETRDYGISVRCVTK